MGLFDWFRRPKSVEQVADLIWLTRGAKLRGLVEEVASSEDNDLFTLIVAHFPATLHAVCEALRQADVKFEQIDWRCDTDQISRLVDKHVRCPYVILADVLQSTESDNRHQLVDDNSPVATVLVAERHPLVSEDAKIVTFAHGLACRCRLRFLVSLEDALMQRFAGEWVRSVLERLGMQQGECIESQMVARRIQQAQQKIEAQSLGNAKAESPEQWFELNFPSRPQ